MSTYPSADDKSVGNNFPKKTIFQVVLVEDSRNS